MLQTVSKERVIIMELCAGGSLFSILEQPENTFGFVEEEFIVFFNDISKDSFVVVVKLLQSCI